MPESAMRQGTHLGTALARLGRVAGITALVGVAAELAVGFIDSDLSLPHGRLRLITAAAWLTGPLAGAVAMLALGARLSGSRDSRVRTGWLMVALCILLLVPVVMLLLDAKLLLDGPVTADTMRLRVQVFGGAFGLLVLSVFLGFGGRMMLVARDRP